MRHKFQKGNPGKPKGAKNKKTVTLRETINNFLAENFNVIKMDFETLTAKERAKVYCDLLQYGLPKLQSTQLITDFEKMTDQQLEDVIRELKTSVVTNHLKIAQ